MTGADVLVIIMGVIAIIAGVLLWLFSIRKKKLTRSGGVVMLMAYAAYFVYLCQ